jgi:GDP-L-fucose synthase
MKRKKFFYKKKIYVAGHKGMVGRALIKQLNKLDCIIITVEKKTLDLRDQKKVNLWFKKKKPDYVFLLAAKVGGINANNKFPADFIYDNIMIQTNIIKSSFESKVKKLIFLGSSCVYPNNIKRKINESDLMSGPLEETNKAYAIAKISGLEMVKSFRKQYGCNFISAMPCNIYGEHDNFDAYNSHVFPALIKKFIEAKFNNKKVVKLWGNGTAKREFIYAGDIADALIFLIEKYNDDQAINIGANKDISIINLARLIAKILKYNVKLIFDTNYPNGTQRKKLSTKKIEELGWKPKINLNKGIRIVSRWFIKNRPTY